jgi:hypothetical protein
MRMFTRTLALILVAGVITLIATGPQAQRGETAEEGDWANGWNTWLTSEEGDWVRYRMGEAGVRYEVLERLEGNRIRFQNTTWAGERETSDREFTRPFARLPGPRMPFGDVAVEWREETFRLGGVDIKCDVARWAIEGSVNEIWLSREVPCGGIVKQMAGGVVSVQLIAMQAAGGDPAEAADDDANEGEVDKAPEGLPEFFQKVGNVKVLRVTPEGQSPTFQRREVVRFTEDSVVVMATIVDAEGLPVVGGRPPNEMVQSVEDWKEHYGSPDERGVKVEVPAGVLECDLFKRSNGEEWVHKGVIVKRTIVTPRGTTLIELTSMTMGE